MADDKPIPGLQPTDFSKLYKSKRRIPMYWRYNNYHPADQTKCLCLTKDNVYMTCVAYKSAAFRGDWGWMRYECGHTTGYELTDIEKWCPLYQ